LIESLISLEISKPTIPHLKIIVTSRPYWEIERKFAKLIENVPQIELSGNEESESIRKEIDIVIRARVTRMSEEIFMTPEDREYLLEYIMKMENRTYLWSHLTLGLLEAERRIDASKLSKLGLVPDSVETAYSAILSKSTDAMLTKKLLHIVVGAYRSLTL
jgi:hypothetical protein